MVLYKTSAFWITRRWFSNPILWNFYPRVTNDRFSLKCLLELNPRLLGHETTVYNLLYETQNIRLSKKKLERQGWVNRLTLLEWSAFFWPDDLVEVKPEATLHQEVTSIKNTAVGRPMKWTLSCGELGQLLMPWFGAWPYHIALYKDLVVLFTHSVLIKGPN